jgi:predicted TIM-barrel fold metal-dependent hydrolase
MPEADVGVFGELEQFGPRLRGARPDRESHPPSLGGSIHCNDAGRKIPVRNRFDGIDAIDIHTHVEVDSHGHKAHDDELIAATDQYFKLGPDRLTTVDGVAEHYRQRNTAAVVFTIDAESASGHQPNSVEDLVEGAARNNDVLIPFGTVDPLTGEHAVRRVHSLADEYGVKGFKFHPSLQGFEPNDRSGWSPKYFPPQLVRAAGRQLRTKVLFGTDYPYIQLDRWRRDFESLDMDADVLPLIFKDNALRVLGVRR